MRLLKCMDSVLVFCSHAAQVNYFGTARCTRMALPYMRDSADSIKPERPHIVNVSATAGLVGLPFAGLPRMLWSDPLCWGCCHRHNVKGSLSCTGLVHPCDTSRARVPLQTHTARPSLRWRG